MKTDKVVSYSFLEKTNISRTKKCKLKLSESSCSSEIASQEATCKTFKANKVKKNDKSSQK